MVDKAKEKLNSLKARQSCLEWELKVAMGTAWGIEGIITISPVHKNPTFNVDGLQTEHPDIHAKYLVEESKLKSTFTLVSGAMTAAKLEPELVAREKVLKEQAVDELDGLKQPEAKRTVPLAELHDQYLKALSKTSDAAIQKELIDAELKVACGAAKGIEGVCKWPRPLVTISTFNRSAFEEAHPDLLAKYIVPAKPPDLRVKIRQMRPYLFDKPTQ